MSSLLHITESVTTALALAPAAAIPIRDAAEQLQAGLSTVHRWCTRGIRVGNQVIRLRHVRHGRRIFVPRDALDEFAEACTQAGLLDDEADHAPRTTDGQRRADLDALDAEARKEGL